MHDSDALNAWNDACRLINSREESTALAILIRLSDNDYHGAAAAIGRLYEKGGVNMPLDLPAARYWFERAISDSDNDNDSRVALARVILKSDPAQAVVAINHLRVAAKNSNPIALGMLAVFFERGAFVSHNEIEAERHYRRASELGLVYAMVRLSKILCSRGQIISGIKLRIKATIKTFKVIRSNPTSWELWQYV